MPPSIPSPTSLQRRQILQTVATAVNIATVSITPTGTALGLNPNAGADAEPTGTQTYAGIGGTVTLVTTSTSLTETTPGPTPASSLHANSTKPISMTAVIAVFVVVPVLCALLVGSVCWKRKRNQKKMIAARRQRQIDRERNRSIVGLGGFSKPMESNEEDLKSVDLDLSRSSHIPSPAVIKYAFLEKPEHHPMSNVATHSASKAATNKSRRVSTKSTTTVKINPSNNFAAPSHDESHEDSWAASNEDARSMHSRYPLSPTSDSFMPSPLSSLAYPGRLHQQESQHSSFLTFKSGEVEGDDVQQGSPRFSLGRAESPFREGPMVQNTPAPKRALTYKSQKGGQVVDVSAVSAVPKTTSALDNLIAALDKPDQRRQSTVTTYVPHASYSPMP